jgi:REP-associated tyrosine transposase
MTKLARQLDLPLRTWGGRRAGAGRKLAVGRRAGVPHTARPEHKTRHPVHVTLRAVPRLASLRKQSVFLEMRRAFSRASREWFRVLHFSVQSDHVHLMVEAADKGALSRGTAGLSIRLARSVNRVLGRRGRIWGDRYHARALRTPREVRNGIVYVLTNWRKHVAAARGFDRCSSASWFDGWKGRARRTGSTAWDVDDDPPVTRPATWLASRGWRRHGCIHVDEQPR